MAEEHGPVTSDDVGENREEDNGNDDNGDNEDEHAYETGLPRHEKHHRDEAGEDAEDEDEA